MTTYTHFTRINPGRLHTHTDLNQLIDNLEIAHTPKASALSSSVFTLTVDRPSNIYMHLYGQKNTSDSDRTYWANIVRTNGQTFPNVKIGSILQTNASKQYSMGIPFFLPDAGTWTITIVDDTGTLVGGSGVAWVL